MVYMHRHNRAQTKHMFVHDIHAYSFEKGRIATRGRASSRWCMSVWCLYITCVRGRVCVCICAMSGGMVVRMSVAYVLCMHACYACVYVHGGRTRMRRCAVLYYSLQLTCYTQLCYAVLHCYSNCGFCSKPYTVSLFYFLIAKDRDGTYNYYYYMLIGQAQ